MRTLQGVALTAALLIVIFGAYGVVDRIDRDADARAEYRRWVAESCLPLMVGESAVIVRDSGQIHCRIYSNAEYGRAAKLVSAAVMEPPL